MSNGDDPFWPEGYDLPAFRVQRERYGGAQGGDYTRGATGGVPQTALRYASTVPGYDLVKGKARLVARPYNHTTAQIMWDWPDSYEEKWNEVALVRSAFGFPSTVNDGQTVFWSPIENFFSDLDDDLTGRPILVVPPVVYDLNLPGDRWYYYTLFFKMGLYDWVVGMTDATLVPEDHYHAEHLFNAIPPYYQWVDENQRVGSGPLRQFLKLFGFELDLTRAYVDSYQQLYHFDLAPMALLKQAGNNIGVPYEAGLGDIRHRALLAQIGKLYDIRGTAKGLEQMCEAVSKYECNVTGGSNLLPLPDDSDPYWSIGSWASIHSDTWTPAGLPLPAPLGFGRVRLYLPGEGYPASDVGVVPAYPKTDPIAVLSPPGGRGVLRLDSVRNAAGDSTNDTKPLFVGIGDGIQYGPGSDPADPVNQQAVIPLYAAVAVQVGRTYGFSFYVKTNQPFANPLTITPIMLWMGYSGQPADYVDASYVGPTPINAANTWQFYETQGTAPPGAYYLVPSIYFNGRVVNPAAGMFSYTIDLGSILVYFFGGEEGGAAISPDRYLTLGDPNEPIGPPDPGAAPPFPGYLLGAPIEENP